MWESKISAGAIGAVQSTSVSSDKDLDESGNFVAFIRLEPNFVALFEELSAAKIPSFCAIIYNNLFGEFPIRTVLDSKSGKKPVLTDSSTNGCRCQLQEVPQSHAQMPIFGFQIARWELFGKISACFHLLLFTIWPALDSITDLVYILSQSFCNYYLFAASVLCFILQVWCFIARLKRHRVLEAVRLRKIELTLLKGLSWWPKWASPDSLLVFLCHYK
jgi:hypothetical protein